MVIFGGAASGNFMILINKGEEDYRVMIYFFLILETALRHG